MVAACAPEPEEPTVREGDWSVTKPPPVMDRASALVKEMLVVAERKVVAADAVVNVPVVPVSVRVPVLATEMLLPALERVD